MAKQSQAQGAYQRAVNGCIVVLFVIVAGIALVTYIGQIPEMREADRIRDQLEPYVKQFVATAHPMWIISGMGSSYDLVSEDPYIEGKAILIRMEKGFGELQLLLPEEIQATTPEEISTVILVSCDDREKVGTYENGASAYRVICKVVVVNPMRQTRFSAESLEGSDPPESINSESEYGIGAEPSYSYYVGKLPRK